MIVVAGGLGTGFDAAVQIYDLPSGPWRLASNSLPHYLREGEVVDIEDTFLIVGGYDGPLYDATTDEILQFNPDDETCTIREERLALGRTAHFAALVDGTKYNCS